MADTTSQPTTQAMSSLPPQLGPGGHPRYNPPNLDRDRQGQAASMGYGGPPPPPGSYGNSYASYPPPPYGSGMHGNYGAASMTGGPPPPGYPRGAPGYSVPPHSSAYGAPGYGPNAGPGGFPPSVHHPPYYGGGYESHYGGQPPPPGHPSHPQGPPSSYRGPSPIPPPTGSGPGSSVVRGPNTGGGGGGVPPVSTSSDPQHSLVSAGSSLLSKKARSPPKLNTADKTGSSSQQSPETTQQQQQQQHNLPDHSEVERLRAAAATEITTEEVKPIQTDFHFFVKDHIETYRKLAEEEVRGSMEDKDAALDPTLVNSNLNTRLMKAWEGLTKESRDAYMTQEEADRRRFMEDDEIASRHCATLTARGKSPRVVTSSTSDSNNPKPKVKKETNPSPQKMDAAAAAITVPKTVSVKTEEEEKKAEVPSTNEDPKRSAPESSTGEASGANDIHESPTKKSKAE